MNALQCVHHYPKFVGTALDSPNCSDPDLCVSRQLNLAHIKEGTCRPYLCRLDHSNH